MSRLHSHIWVLAVGLSWTCASLAWAQAPAASDSGRAATVQASSGAAPDADGLARYVPQNGLKVYFEMRGLDAQSAAWEQTAAHAILSRTKTGPMLEEILTQLHAQFLAAPGSKVTSAEEFAMLKHLLQRGLVFAMSEGQQPGPNVVLVMRDAFRDDVKAMFARQVLEGMAPDVKPEMQDKPGGRRVAVMPTKSGQPAAWWVENRRDIVVVTPPGYADAVISAIEGKQPDARSHPIRTQLATPSGDAYPLAWAFVTLEGLPLPPEISELGIDGLKSIKVQWGVQGKALRSEVEIEAPAPRKGLLQLVDQPTFSPAALPAIPEGTDSVSMLSLNLDESLNRLSSLLESLNVPGATDVITELEADFKKQTRLDLRGDVLRQLGPRMLAYTIAPKKSALSALNALNPLAGLQVPRFVVMIEVKDASLVQKSLGQLMSFANAQLAEIMPAAPEPEPAPGARPATRSRSTASSARRKAGAVEFKMTSPKPVTYQLNLQPELAALTNLKLTIALGTKHLIVASAPDLVAGALKLEETPDAQWQPSDEFASALQGVGENLVYLQVTDPRDKLPLSIVQLPTSIQTLLTQVGGTMSAAMGGAPGMGMPPGIAAPAGASGGPPGVVMTGSGMGMRLQGINPGGGPPGADAGAQTGAPSPGVLQRGGGSSGSGSKIGIVPPPSANTPPPAAGVRLQIDPDKIPSVTDIRPHLFPGSMAISVDGRGVRLVAREAFFDISTLTQALEAFAMGMSSSSSSGMAAAPTGFGAPPGPPGTPNTPAGRPGAAGGGASTTVPD